MRLRTIAELGTRLLRQSECIVQPFTKRADKLKFKVLIDVTRHSRVSGVPARGGKLKISELVDPFLFPMSHLDAAALSFALSVSISEVHSHPSSAE